jgi:hypothetical protein
MMMMMIFWGWAGERSQKGDCNSPRHIAQIRGAVCLNQGETASASVDGITFEANVPSMMPPSS